MHQQKVGSFKYTETTSKSGSNELILTVLSVNAEGVAQIVLAGPSYEGWWKFIRGNIVSERLEFRVADVPSSPHLSFRWRDANSGRMTMMWPGTSNASPVSSTFERLDG